MASVAMALLPGRAEGLGQLGRPGRWRCSAALPTPSLDLIASLVTFLGVRWAAMPADERPSLRPRQGRGAGGADPGHPDRLFGARHRLARDRALLQRRSRPQGLELGVGVSIFAMAATLALLAYQRHVIRRTGSVAISTDHLHYQSDLLLNLSVIVALVLDQMLGWRLADPIFGLAIALWLLFGAWQRGQPLDRPADGPRMAGGGARRLPRRHAGLSRTRRPARFPHPPFRAHRFVQFHVWVPADWTVREAHDRLDSVEEQLQARFPGTEILIHLDPEGPHRPRNHAAVRSYGASPMTPLSLLPGRCLCRQARSPAIRRRSCRCRNGCPTRSCRRSPPRITSARPPSRARRAATMPITTCAGSRRRSRSSCAAMRRLASGHVLLHGERIRFATQVGRF